VDQHFQAFGSPCPSLFWLKQYSNRRGVEPWQKDDINHIPDAFVHGSIFHNKAWRIWQVTVFVGQFQSRIWHKDHYRAMD
jgi:hypothetical protein